MEKTEVIEAINYLRKYKTETDRIEAKTANGGFPKKCYDTFSSFSNKYGGMIIFGINEENNFSTEGVYDVKDLQEQISNLLENPSALFFKSSKIFFLIVKNKFIGLSLSSMKIINIIQNTIKNTTLTITDKTKIRI